LSVLRTNRESLMSVLETFLHDPLCEWTKRKNTSTTRDETGEAENEMAVRYLKVIDKKLVGFTQASLKIGLPLNVEGQVSELIQQATDPENLSRMYIGWAPYL
jgi:serine/threonine-protein kinase ATR